MATTTPNFGWAVPTSTDLVKDGATAIELLGDSIDASLVDLKGGTTGQILSKASATDLDYTWITNDVGDITGVTAGTGLSGGGTSGAVTLAIDSTVATLTGTQTLTNKTLTAPIINIAFNAQTGTTYTPVAGDVDKLVTLSNTSPITLTVPPDVFVEGNIINIQRINTGSVTLNQGAGVTITSTGSGSLGNGPLLRARFSAASIICTSSNVFTVIGDIA